MGESVAPSLPIHQRKTTLFKEQYKYTSAIRVTREITVVRYFHAVMGGVGGGMCVMVYSESHNLPREIPPTKHHDGRPFPKTRVRHDTLLEYTLKYE